VPFLVVEIALFQFEIIFQPISLFLPTFASGIKKQRPSFKVLRPRKKQKVRKKKKKNKEKNSKKQEESKSCEWI
jgi:hypothetical protein